ETTGERERISVLRGLQGGGVANCVRALAPRLSRALPDSRSACSAGARDTKDSDVQLPLLAGVSQRLARVGREGWRRWANLRSSALAVVEGRGGPPVLTACLLAALPISIASP